MRELARRARTVLLPRSTHAASVPPRNQFSTAHTLSPQPERRHVDRAYSHPPPRLAAFRSYPPVPGASF